MRIAYASVRDALDHFDLYVVGADGGKPERLTAGDTVADVLKYVSYDRDDLVARVRRAAEKSLRAGRMTFEDSRSVLRLYEQGLAGYTYLERE